MFIMTAKTADNILNNLESGTADPRQVQFQLQMHRNAMKFYSENSDKIPTDENYLEAARNIAENLGVAVSLEQIKTILSLFPSARIKLAVYEGCFDTEVRDLIHEAACAYFAGAETPTFGDKINTERFYTHLQVQAKEMGFELVTEE
jgi:hypothetical protein